MFFSTFRTKDGTEQQNRVLDTSQNPNFQVSLVSSNINFVEDCGIGILSKVSGGTKE